MTHEQQAKLVLVMQIAMACEKAYRRGFQQGHIVGQEQPKVTQDDVAKWRNDGSSMDYALAEGPPGTLWAGRIEHVIERLKMEAGHLDQLIALVHEHAGTVAKATAHRKAHP